VKTQTLITIAVASAAVVAIVAALYWVSPVVFYIVLTEIPAVLGIFLASLTVGCLPVRWLVPKLTISQRLVASWALGSGLLATLILLAGLAGLLSRTLWLIAVIALAAVALGILYKNLRRTAAEKVVYEFGRWWALLLLVIFPFAVMALAAATVPPGFLWSAEGGGYDVLEYHLQVPNEWYHAGRIEFLPHNAYANLPANAEMFYLLATILNRGPYAAVYAAQLTHTGFAFACVLAVWIFVRPWGTWPAALAAAALATCGWMAYLAPLAYVEMPMLFLSIVMVGVLVTTLRDATLDLRASGLIGLMLGLVGGYKYTALAMLAPGVVIAAALGAVAVRRYRGFLLYPLAVAVFAAIGLSPYLLRNLFWTGNPVFPIAYDRFGGRDWSDALAERWQQGHSPRPDQQSVAGRLAALYWTGGRNIVVDHFLAQKHRNLGDQQRARDILNPPPILDLPRFGLAVLLLPWLVFLTRRQRFCDHLLLLILLIGIAVWLFATHLQGRFLVPLLALVPFLIARSAETVAPPGRQFWSVPLVALLLIASGINWLDAQRRYHRHLYAPTGQPLNLFGAHAYFLRGDVPGSEYLGVVNEQPNARVMLIGEARPFYVIGNPIYWTVFNRNDFAQAAGIAPGLRDLKEYLARTKPDYIYVDWLEIRRLADTYGFDQSIRPRIFRYLNSRPQFTVRRAGAWGPTIEFRGDHTPARVLYRVNHSPD